MKKMFIKLLFFVLFLVGGSALYAQTTFTVSNTSSNPLVMGSLAKAIADVNNLPPAPAPLTNVVIEFDASLAGQTINVPLPLNITYTNGLITFNNTNVDITLDGLNANQILRIDDFSVNVVIQKTKFTKALGGAIFIGDILANAIGLQINNCQFEDNNSANSGAAIYVENNNNAISTAITLQIQNTIFKNNRVDVNGGAIFLHAGNVKNINTTINNCQFLNNEAGSKGGAIKITGLPNNPTINNTLFDGNKVTSGDGGAIHAENNGVGAPSFNLTNCIFKNNTVLQNGGALYIGGTTGFKTNLTDCQAYQNQTSTGDGGFIYQSGTENIVLNRCAVYKNNANGTGGGLHQTSGALFVNNSSFIENRGVNGGGGLFVASAATLRNATIAGNIVTSGSNNGGGINFDGLLSIYNCLIGNNSAVINQDIHQGGGLFNENNNWISDQGNTGLITGIPPNPSNSFIGQAWVDAKVTPLTDENGFIYAYKPNFKTNSPLIGVGNIPDISGTTDQLGNARTVGGNVDIGAVQVPFTRVVTNTLGNIGDVNSLPWAVAQVNTLGSITEPSEILFDILPYTTVHLIQPAASLAITRPTIINGFSQNGSSANSLATGYNADLRIVVDGNGNTPVFRFDTNADNSVVKGLVINASAGGGTTALAIDIEKIQIKGCIIGLNNLGTTAGVVSLAVGIDMSLAGDNTQIGGEKPEERNIISNCNVGIGIQAGSTNNKIQNNYIGTDKTGTSSIGNATGIGIFGNNNLIGGNTEALRNIISASVNYGIAIYGGANNQIKGNYIGTNATGNSVLANGARGISIEGSSNIVGGYGAFERNLISGTNGNVGIAIEGAGNLTNNEIIGNYIGTDRTGANALPNGLGILINGLTGPKSNTKIIANVISGNIGLAGGDGIRLTGSGVTDTQILQNIIGLNATKTAALPNEGEGININDAGSGITVGMQDIAGVAQGNFIGKNDKNGIFVINTNSVSISYNHIGTDLSQNDFGNTQNGIELSSVNTSNITQNTLAYNGQSGISLFSGLTNNLTNNFFFNNALLGIDLENNGATLNDANDSDFGANNLMNYPEIQSFTKVAGTSDWTVSYQVPSAGLFNVYFYLSDGNAQGKTLLAAFNAGGNTATVSTFSNANLNYGDKIVAHAHSIPLNASSEFSPDFLLINPCPIKPVVSNIKIDQKVTCTVSEAKATITLATNSPAGTYEIDFQGDGTYDLGGLTLSNNELVFNLANGTVLSNPLVRNLAFISCPSDPFVFSQTVNISPLQVATIQSVRINEPTNCDSSNGNIIISLAGNVSGLGYDVDLENDSNYEFISVRPNSANQLIINNLAGGTRIGTIQIRQSFGADCRTIFQNQTRTLRFVSVSQSSNPLLVKVENSQLDFETETTVELSNTEIGLSYALAFNTAFNTANLYYLTDFQTANAQTLKLKTGKLYANGNFKVVIKNASGCEETVPNSSFAIQVSDGIFASQIDVLKIIYDRTGGKDWKRKWVFTKPQRFSGVKFSQGNVLEIDLSDQNIKDTIIAQPFKLLPKLQLLNVESNLLTFSSLEDFAIRNYTFKYTKQEKIGKELRFTTVEGANLKLEIKTGGKALKYQWFRNNEAIAGATEAILTVEKIKLTETGIYFCSVTSNLAQELSLQSKDMFVSVLPLPSPQDLSKLRIFFEQLNGENWTNKWNFNDPNLANWYGLRINQNNKVVEISLADNNLSGEIPAEAFTGTNNIFAEMTHLNLSNNNISKIPDELALLSKLNYLDLSKNQFKGAVPQIIFKFSNLQTLFLDHNQFDQMPPEIGNLSKIRMLFLGNNLFKTLPNDMAKLAGIEVLYLNNNLLQNLDWNIGMHQKMRLLSLSNNQFKQLPLQINSLKNLEEFAIASNFLSEIPNGFGDLPKLVFLNISDNYLDFGDLEKILKANAGGRIENLARFYYTPQARFGTVQNLTLPQGNTLNLNAETEGTANIYQWFRNGVEIKNNVSPLRNGLKINNIDKNEGGVYTVAVSNPIAPELTLYGREYNVTVTCALQTPITISLRGSENICEGENTDRLLTINNLTNETVQWFRDNVRLAGQTNSNLSTIETGTYKVLITDQTGCSSFTNEITIKRFPKPQVQLEANFALLKVRDASQYVSFQWFRNSVAIPNATRAAWQAVELGTYQVRITDRNGCLGLSNTFAITPTATENLDNQDFIRLYPNPVQTELHIFVPSRQARTYEMSLWNAQGQKIQGLEKQGFSNLTEKLNLENLPSGLYLLKLKVGEEIFLKKVMIGK